MSIAEIIVLGPGEGKTVSVLGDQYTFKAVGRDRRWRSRHQRRRPARPRIFMRARTRHSMSLKES